MNLNCQTFAKPNDYYYVNPSTKNNNNHNILETKINIPNN